MTNKKEGVHNSLVDRVEEELIKRGYDSINKYVVYERGELDLYCRVNNAKNYYLLFEIKCSYTKKAQHKALDQLFRAERFYFKKHDRIFKFFVYEEDGLCFQWIKKTYGGK